MGCLRFKSMHGLPLFGGIATPTGPSGGVWLSSGPRNGSGGSQMGPTTCHTEPVTTATPDIRVSFALAVLLRISPVGDPFARDVNAIGQFRVTHLVLASAQVVRTETPHPLVWSCALIEKSEKDVQRHAARSRHSCRFPLVSRIPV